MTLTKEDTDNLPPSQYDEMTRASTVPQSWRSVSEVAAEVKAGVSGVSRPVEVARDDADMM